MPASLKLLPKKQGSSFTATFGGYLPYEVPDVKYATRANELSEMVKKAPDNLYRYEDGKKYGTAQSTEYTKAALKKLANHQWYTHNKLKKQKYNKQYYQENREYWQNRYEKARQLYDQMNAINDHNIQKRIEAEGEGLTDIAKSRLETQRKQEEDIGKIWPEMDQAYINYKRAEQEEKDFLDSHKRMPLKEAWKQGADVLVNAGREFIDKLIGR